MKKTIKYLIIGFLACLNLYSCSNPDEAPPYEIKRDGVSSAPVTDVVESPTQVTTAPKVEIGDDTSIKIVENLDLPTSMSWEYANVGSRQESVKVSTILMGSSLKILYSFNGIHFYTTYKLDNWNHLINTANSRVYRFLKTTGKDEAGFTYTIRFTTDFNTGNVLSLEIDNVMFSNSKRDSSPKPVINYDDFHTVKSGESLNLIAAKYGMTLEQLINLNPKFKNNRTIMVGEIIKLR